MENHNVVKASEVTGVKVEGIQGENLGKINEIVIDKTSGKVNYLVLDFGGVLGFGNKFFAIPWHLFSYNNQEDCYLLKTDKERLKNAPGFDKNHWPDFAAPDYTKTIDTYYR